MRATAPVRDTRVRKQLTFRAYHRPSPEEPPGPGSQTPLKGRFRLVFRLVGLELGSDLALLWCDSARKPRGWRKEAIQ